MIYTLTVNPTRDKTLSVPRLVPGEIHRAQLLRQDLGGKGINVSRALLMIGIQSRPVAFVGGATGQVFRDGLAALGFDPILIEVDGETRQNLTLLDESTGVYTKINEPGARVTAAHINNLMAQIDMATHPGDLWILAGSLPPGAPADLYAQLIAHIHARGGRALLDTSGDALQAGITARPFMVKPNSEEAAELLGEPLVSDDDHTRAVTRLLEQVEVVALTRGADGLVLGMRGTGQVIFAVPPAVEARSPVGAGDAALTGVVWGLLDNCAPVDIARRAVACGTAAAMQEGTALGERALVESLLGSIHIHTIAS